MGRPTLLTRELAGQIVQLVEVGQYPAQAAVSVGIDRATYYNWMKRGREAHRTQKTGAPLSQDEVPFLEFFDAVTRAGAKGIGRHVTIIALAAEKDWRASAFFLERRDPKRWGRRDHLAVEGQMRHSGRVRHGLVVGQAAKDPEAARLVHELLVRLGQSPDAGGAVGPAGGVRDAGE